MRVMAIIVLLAAVTVLGGGIATAEAQLTLPEYDQQEVPYFTTLRLDMTASNASGPVTYRVDARNALLRIHPTTGHLVFMPLGIPGDGNPGTVTVRASDGVSNVHRNISVLITHPAAFITEVTNSTASPMNNYRAGIRDFSTISFKSITDGMRPDTYASSTVSSFRTGELRDGPSFPVAEHPRPNTLYYIEAKKFVGGIDNSDGNSYASFTPRENGFERIPNPNTRPAPYAPDVAVTRNGAEPTVITPRLVSFDGDDLTITGASGAEWSTVTHTATTVTYTPRGFPPTTDTVTYTVTDDRGVSSNGTITISDVEGLAIRAWTTLRLDMAVQNSTGPVTYSIDPPVDGARIHPVTGHLVYVPPKGNINTDPVLMVHADDGISNDTTAVNVDVTAWAADPQGSPDGQSLQVRASSWKLFLQFYRVSDGIVTPRDSSEASFGPSDTRGYLIPFLTDEHPLPNTLYYADYRRDGDPQHDDGNVFIQFTPRVDDSHRVIANPNTRPAPVAPYTVWSVDAGTPEIIEPVLVGLDGNDIAITGVTDGTMGTARHTATAITYVPRPGIAGSDTITYTVVDNKGVTGNGTIDITILSDSAVLPDHPDQSVNVDSTLRLDMAASNATGPVAYSIEPAVDGARIHPEAGQLVYVPVEDDAGQIKKLTVYARDSLINASKSIDVAVGDPVASVDAITARADPPGNTVEGTAHVIIDYSFESLSGGMNTRHGDLHSSNATSFTGGSGALEAGLHPAPNTIYYVAAGPSGANRTADQNIYAEFTPRANGSEIIPNPNTRPAPYAPDLEAAVNQGRSIVITPSLTGMDGGDIAITGVTDGMMGTANHTATAITYVSDGDAGGTDIVTYTVTDDAGQESDGIINVTVVIPPLSLPYPDDQSVDVYRTLRLNMTAQNATEAITYSIEPLEGAFIHPSTGRLVYVPVADHVGTPQTLRVHADNGMATVTREIGVTVGGSAAEFRDIAASDADPLANFVHINRTETVHLNFASRSGDKITDYGTMVLSPGSGDDGIRTPDFQANEHPRPDTLYYVEARGPDDKRNSDGNIYAKFTPRETGFKIIPNPETRPELVAPNINKSGPVAMPVTIRPYPPGMEGDITITGVTGATQGTVVRHATTITYTSDEGATGTDTINYAVADDTGGTAMATATINLVPAVVPDIDNLAVNVSGTLRLEMALPDAAGNTRYRISPPVEGARIHPISGHLVYVPVAGHVDTPPTLMVHADDGANTVTRSLSPAVGAGIASVAVRIPGSSDPLKNSAEVAANVAAEYSFESLSGDERTRYGVLHPATAGTTATLLSPDFASGDHPAPDTLYYAEAGRWGGDRYTDENVYAEFTPRVSGSEIIPNPNTRPAPFAPYTSAFGGAGVPIHIMPELVGMDGDDITITAVTNGTMGTATTNGTAINYTSYEDASGLDTITYTVTDDRGRNATGIITVLVSPESLTLSDPDGMSVNAFETLRVEMTVQNASGQVRYSMVPLEGAFIHPHSGHLVYVPTAAQQGAQTITVRAADDRGTAVTTIPVTVGAPAATVHSITRQNDGSYTATFDRSAGLHTMRFESITDGQEASDHGVAFTTPAALADSTHSSSVLGSEHPRADTIYYFGFEAVDSSDNADKRIHAQFTPGKDGFRIIPNPLSRPAHHAPDINITVQAGGSVTVTPELIDGDGNALRITGVTGAIKGTAETDGVTLNYTAGAGMSGDDAATYTVTDNMGADAEGTMHITITSGDPADRRLSLPDISAKSVNAHSTLRVPVEAQNAAGPVRYSIVPLEGAFIHPHSGQLYYVPTAAQQGAQTLTVRAADGQNTAVTTIPVTVGAPVATINRITSNANDTHTVTFDTGSTKTRSDFVSWNDNDARPAGFGPKTSANQANVEANTFELGDGHPRADSIYYFLIYADVSGITDNDRVYTQFVPGHDGFRLIPSPQTRPDHYVPDIDRTIQIGEPVNVAPELVGQDGNALVITGVTNGTKGIVQTDGVTVTYRPHAGSVGQDMATYTVTDNIGAERQGDIRITIEDTREVLLVAPPETAEIDEHQRYRLDLDIVNPAGAEYDLNVTLGEPAATGAAIGAGDSLVWTPGEEHGGATYPVTIYLMSGAREPASHQIMLTVTETNEKPVFDAIETNRGATVGEPFSLDLDATDPDRPHQDITYRITSQNASENPAAINGTSGLVTWTPEETGLRVITVQAADDFEPPGTANITLAVTAGETPNMAPTASNATIRVDPSGTTSIDLAGEGRIDDGEQDAATLTVTVSDTPAPRKGNATASGTTVTYTAYANATGTDEISYTVTDDGGLVATSVIRVDINIREAPPRAPDVAVNTTENTPAIVTPRILDPDGGTAVITGVTNGTNGTAISSVTTVIYTPERSFNGDDQVIYTVQDDENQTSTGIINITVTPVNDPPVFDAVRNWNINAGSNLNFTVTAGDIDGDPLMFGLAEAPSEARITPDGNFSWTPTEDDIENHTVTITVSDGRGGMDTETITIHVLPADQAVNQPPALDPIGNRDVLEGMLLSIEPRADDLEGDPLSYGLVRGTLPEAATFNDTSGYLVWTPGEEDGGTSHNITITVSDGRGSDSENVTITVMETNQNPVIAPVMPQSAVVGEELTLQITASDADIPEQMLSYDIPGNTLGAILSNTTSSGTTLSWTPNSTHAGDRSITVLVEDDYDPKGSAAVVIPITVSPAMINNSTMTNSTMTNSTVINSTMTNRDPAAPDILINAELFFPSAVTPAVTDPDGDDITITHVTEPALGILDTSMLPQISYTPSQTGIDRLNYTATDNRGGTDTGTITIFINPEGNARPELDHIYNVGGRVGVDLEFTTAADDSDDTSFTFDIANVPDGASITPGGDFSWRPASSQNGTHTVTFIVYDDSGGADWQHVLVTILRADETNLPPVPQDIEATVVLGGGRGFQPDIADPEEDMTEIVRVYDSSLGDVDRSFTSQGIIVYVAGVLGNDEVIYTVSDGRGGFANGTLSITVEEPANVRPLIEFVGDKSVNAGDELTFTVDADDLDGLVVDFGLEGDTQGPSMSPLGVFSWTPTANDVGRHEFTILVFDDAGENSTVSIAVTVRPEGYRNSPPVAPDVVIMTPQDVLSIIRPTLTDPDEGDPVRISQTGNTAKGSILSGFLRAGIIIYLPNQGEFGTETVSYTVSDSSDDTDTATINVFISARGNTDPILGSIYFRNINAGDPLAFDLEAEDPDGDTISYQTVGAPDGVEISPEGAFSWTPTAADVGNHTFTVIAYDDRGGADSKTAVIRVLPAGTANQAPSAPDSTVTVAPGGSIVITPAISDPDGDRVTIDDAVASGTGVVIQSEDSINYIHVATTPTETITYTVTDARGAASTGTITVTIQ